MAETKAFILWANGAEYEGQEVVLASSRTEAKMRSELRHNTDWIDIRVKRYPRFDGKDRITDKDMLLNGWVVICPECDHSYSAEDFEDAGVDPNSLHDSILCPYCNPEDYGLIVFDEPIHAATEETHRVLKQRPAETI